MLQKERPARKLHNANLHNKVIHARPCKEIKVWQHTPGTDVQQLTEQSNIIKVCDGALSHSLNYSGSRFLKIYKQHLKKNIAKEKVVFVKDGMLMLTCLATNIHKYCRHAYCKVKSNICHRQLVCYCGWSAERFVSQEICMRG